MSERRPDDGRREPRKPQAPRGKRHRLVGKVSLSGYQPRWQDVEAALGLPAAWPAQPPEDDGGRA